MSLIASFYVLPRAQLDALLEAAVPERREVKRRVPFLPRRVEEHFRFHPFLQTHGRELDAFDASGMAFADLDDALRTRGTSVFDPPTLTSENERLAAALQHTAVLFDHAGARQLLSKLSPLQLDAAEIAEALRASERAPGEEAIASVQQAFAHLRRWLEAVPEDHLGLLDVG